MERLDELHRATLVDQPWRPLRGAVIASRREVAATLVDRPIVNVPAGTTRAPRTPPAPPPKPQTPRTEAEAPGPAPATNDPLEQLAGGCY